MNKVYEKVTSYVNDYKTDSSKFTNLINDLNLPFFQMY